MQIFSEYGFGLVQAPWSLFSVSFLAFLAITIILYYSLPQKLQWAVLLGASLVFYFFAGTPYTVAYLFLSTLATWKASCIIADFRQAGREQKQIKRVYLAALFVNVAILALLKYTNFLLGNVSTIVSWVSGSTVQWRVSWIAALGISFYTLQIISYLTDCYWGIIQPQASYAKFALFACFFPQMVSGPISRYEQLGTQLYTPHPFKKNHLMNGLVRIAIGFFKKLVIAESFTRLTQFFFDAEQGYNRGIYAIIGIGCYVIELYGDFAGCMDIVLGSAKCFGIDVVENFNRPFTSTTIQEFWQRWHITLGTWLKDYIMYPLLRSKVFQTMSKKLRKRMGKPFSQKATTYLAMLILWFCMGLWHGGGWNYITEGLWFWLVIVLGQLTEPFFQRFFHTEEHKGKLATVLRQVRTTCIYAVGAVFFKAPTVMEALRTIYRAVFPTDLIISFANIPSFVQTVRTAEFGDYRLLYLLINGFLGFVIFVMLSLWEKKYGKLQDKLAGHTLILQVTVILAIIYIIAFLGVYGSGFRPSDFIYGGF